MDVVMLIVEKAVIPFLAAVLLAVLPLLLRKLVSLLEAKTKLKLSQDRKELLDKIARDAVAYAEQQALNAVTQKRGKMKSHEKAAAAVEWALSHADELGLDDVAEQAVVDLIEAKVGESNFG